MNVINGMTGMTGMNAKHESLSDEDDLTSVTKIEQKYVEMNEGMN
jgi:hypothetical protein